MIKPVRILIAAFVPFIFCVGAYPSDAMRSAQELDQKSREAYRSSRFLDALTLSKEGLVVREKDGRTSAADIARSLHLVGRAHRALAEFEPARDHLERALATRRSLADPDYGDIAESLMELGMLFREKGDYASSAVNLQLSFNMRVERLGEKHPLTADIRYELGRLKFRQGDLVSARAELEQALAVHRNANGDRDPRTARTMSALGEVLQNAGEMDAAHELLTQALDIQEVLLPADHLDIARTLDRFATILQVRGDYPNARENFERALRIAENTVGPWHPATGLALDSLAGVLVRAGELAEARPMMEKALAVRLKTLGDAHPDTAVSHNNMGSVLHRMGDLAAARPMLEASVRVHEATLGAEHASTTVSLGSLGALLGDMGDFAGARQAFESALTRRERAVGPTNPQLVVLLNNLAFVMTSMGNTSDALPLLDRAAEICASTVGAQHILAGVTLANRGRLLSESGNLESAIMVLQEALAIFNNGLGPSHPRTVRTLNRLGETQLLAGDLNAARQSFESAVASFEAIHGAEHPHTADSHANLGRVTGRQGQSDQAIASIESALAIQEKRFGTANPMVAKSLTELATLYFSVGELDKALRSIERALAIEEQLISDTAFIAPTRQKIEFLQSFRETSSQISSIALSSESSSDARRLAIETVLRRKGRALELSYDEFRLISDVAEPSVRDELDALRTMRERRAFMTLHMPRNVDTRARLDQLRELKEKIERTESSLGQMSRAVGASVDSVTLDSVQSSLRDGQALIEFFTYRPHQLVEGTNDSLAAQIYAVNIIKRNNTHSMVLGPASQIDALAGEFRRAISSQDEDVVAIGRALDALVMETVRKELEGIDSLVISPDGELNLIPFAALVDTRERYLIEDYEISYVSSGRDLRRWNHHRTPREPALVIGGVDFAGAHGPAANTRGIQPVVGLESLHLDPLPGTSEEALQVAGILGFERAGRLDRLFDWLGVGNWREQATDDETPRLLVGADATEAALKRVHGPSILHLATHGFFAPSIYEVPVDTGEGSATSIVPEGDPLLRSGFALAGFNRRSDAKDANDGVVTALEVMGLDLWGTQVVTISACDTGVGDVQAGEGVFGLRRALVLAGARSQVLSLWKLTDRLTQELMVSWYTRLREGAALSIAMRDVQLGLLNSVENSHPYYWSGLIISGDPGPIDIETLRVSGIKQDPG